MESIKLFNQNTINVLNFLKYEFIDNNYIKDFEDLFKKSKNNNSIIAIEPIIVYYRFKLWLVANKLNHQILNITFREVMHFLGIEYFRAKFDGKVGRYYRFDLEKLKDQYLSDPDNEVEEWTTEDEEEMNS